ncbi:superoxide dismutase family protein [Desulfoprunum benzoelyticum]|jgi:Cu-Zn family superoxide dismutase|uniref:Superoxide dismutase [Cu-Zn] n=1 Tax=Desulfoprunum benzoelyticum TaxID=1506996 RepID=A0A840UQE1_9BACT|nr:superoxide dismutase family protein [Desulfoprunum benzoelyticum]MBB5348447.1 Cu-Zn family superoxide dismutase [Desulfoprunum benzoelyticum]MBM9530218.1 superoxide dismutase family protein [Desulfoprunum benzoelyticum]
MKRLLLFAAIIAGFIATPPAFAADSTVTMNLIDEQGVGRSIGTVALSEGPDGLVLTPKLTDLTPGLHGFHIHHNPDCAAVAKDGKVVPGLAAGGHYDPEGTGKHEGFAGRGHLGDLPALSVDADGRATTAMTAPRLKLSNVRNRSLMIHAGGDNYADQPAPLGGGGARIACGVIE